MGVLENGDQFPPGHLAEHLAGATPVRVFFRDENGTPTAYRLEDVLPGRRPATTPVGAATPRSPDRAELVLADDALERAAHDPVASTVNTHGSVRMPHSFDRLDRLELVVRVEDRLEAALGVGELVRLDVDERDVVRGVGRDRLDPVEGRAALRALAERRASRTRARTARCAASASSTVSS